MSKPNGIVVWEGQSLLDGEPIVLIATGLRGGSSNSKTGGLVQTWILARHVHPIVAKREGRDFSVCGDCPHRSKAAGGTNACYVNVAFAPAGIWRAYQRGVYPDIVDVPAKPLANRLVRIGAYGDPAAVPLEVWLRLLEGCAGWTGYTHQWRVAPGLRRWCMASVDSPQEARDALAAGWRTFRIRTAEQPVGDREFVCPASAGAGHKVQCSDCLACNGAPSGKGRRSPVIMAHGTTARRFQSA